MTDSKLLREAIDNSGLKYGYIAKQLGISTKSLQRKIDNESSFKASEIQKLCEILSISSYKTKENIFFSKM